MNESTPSLESELCRYYSIAKIGWHGWLDEFKEFADQQLDQGEYLEVYREVLFERMEDAAVDLIAESIQHELLASLPTPVQMRAHHVEHIMRSIVKSPTNSLQLCHELRVQINDYFGEDQFHINKLLTVFYQWWADDSEWMIEDEYDQAKIRTLTELNDAAQSWIQMYTPIRNHF